SDGVADSQPTVFRDGNDLRSRIAVQVNFGEALLDAPQHRLVPVNLQVRMQTALHQNSGPAKFDGFADLVVDSLEIEDITLFGFGSLQRPVKGAEGTVLSAEVRVINVAIDDVGDHALGVQPAPRRVGFHADADQVIGLEQITGLLLGQGHGRVPTSTILMQQWAASKTQMTVHAVLWLATRSECLSSLWLRNRKYSTKATIPPMRASPMRIISAGL